MGQELKYEARKNLSSSPLFFLVLKMREMLQFYMLTGMGRKKFGGVYLRRRGRGSGAGGGVASSRGAGRLVGEVGGGVGIGQQVSS